MDWLENERTYKDKIKLTIIENILKDINYKNWSFSVTGPWGALKYQYFMINMKTSQVIDIYNINTKVSINGNFKLNIHNLTEKKVLDFIRNIIHKTEIHEADEWFKYKNERIFDPHKKEEKIA